MGAGTRPDCPEAAAKVMSISAKKQASAFMGSFAAGLKFNTKRPLWEFSQFWIPFHSDSRLLFSRKSEFRLPVRHQGVFKFQRCLSLLGSNLASVAKLLPTAESANGSLEFGTALGMRRYVPSVS